MLSYLKNIIRHPIIKRVDFYLKIVVVNFSLILLPAIFITAISLINKTSISRDQNVYQWDYKLTYLQDSHRLITEVYDYLKRYDPLFNRMMLMYEGGYQGKNIVDEIAVHENVIQPKDPALPASSYGEKINYTLIYNAIGAARYFSSLVPIHIRSDLGWQGSIYPYYEGYTFSDIGPHAYSRINYKDTIAILSRVEEKHQQAKETLEKMSISNISSKKLAEIMEKYRNTDDRFEIYSHVFKKIRDSDSILSRFTKKYVSEVLEKVPMKPILTENMIKDMANELKFETIDEQYFSSGSIKFKVTIVKAVMPEHYKKQKRSWDNIECWNFSTTTCLKLSRF